MSVNLSDALLRLSPINGPAASPLYGPGLAGSVANYASSASPVSAGFLTARGVLGSIAGAATQALFNSLAVRSERKWSEKMYNKYNSPAALVRQYQEAGINPALMFGGNPIAAPTASSAAAPIDNPFGDLVGLLGAMMNLEMLDEQKRGLQIANDAAEFEYGLRQVYGPDRADAELRQIEQSINTAIAQCGELATRSALNSAQSDFVKAQKDILDIEKVEKEWRKIFIDKYKMTPELAGDLVKSLTTLASAGLLSITNIAKFFGGKKGTHTRSITEKQADGTTITDVFSGFPDM